MAKTRCADVEEPGPPTSPEQGQDESLEQRLARVEGELARLKARVALLIAFAALAAAVAAGVVAFVVVPGKLSESAQLWFQAPLVIFGGVVAFLCTTFIVLRVLAKLSPMPDAAPPDSRCVNCGYSLTGNVSGVCPECGTPTAEGNGLQREREQVPAEPANDGCV